LREEYLPIVADGYTIGKETQGGGGYCARGFCCVSS
jgi:hypothetical protein